MTTHYETLHVSRTASPEDIKAAYRQQCQKWHPDKNPENYAEAEKLTKIINGAYEILSDPNRRKQYDATLARHDPVHKPTHRSATEQTQQRTAQAHAARQRASEHARRWAAEEIRRNASERMRPSANTNRPRNSLLTQIKLALSFLCGLCIFCWLVVMWLTA